MKIILIIFSVNHVFPIDSAFYTFSTKFDLELKQWLINVERNAPNFLLCVFKKGIEHYPQT